MTEDYIKGRNYSSMRKKYGEEPKIIKTKYLPFGKQVQSARVRKFVYPGSNKPDKSIHDFPVPGHITREIERILARHSRGKKFKLDDILPSLGIIIGAFLLSGNTTGNVVSNLSGGDANLVGAFAIIIGIVGLLVSRRR